MAKQATGGINYPKKAMSLIKNDIMQSINSSYLGKITKVNKPDVSVQPVALTSDNKKQAQIESAMVLVPATAVVDGKLYVDLKEGDDVLVGVIDHDTQYYKYQGNMRVANTTPHNVNDSVILGRVAKASDFK